MVLCGTIVAEKNGVLETPFWSQARQSKLAGHRHRSNCSVREQLGNAPGAEPFACDLKMRH